MKIDIRAARGNECEALYNMMHRDLRWKETDAPYFAYEQPTLEQYRDKIFPHVVMGETRKVITRDDKVVGEVGYYWEYKPTRWLEIGVIIYESTNWGQGIAKAALPIWISEIFHRKNIARVGLTTWSGNPAMMAVAESIGMTLEARLRKVRYYHGQYYDSIKYGVLREEWATWHDC